MKTRKTRRGSALVLTLFFLTLLGLLATALAKMLPIELNAATRGTNDLKGYYSAAAGIDGAIAKMIDVYPAAVTNLPQTIDYAAATPPTPYLEKAVGEYNYKVYLSRPSGFNQFQYRVESWSYRRDLENYRPKIGNTTRMYPGHRKAVAYVEQKNFTDFNFFGEGSGSWNMLATVEGPAHFGGDIQLWVTADRWAANYVTFSSIVTSPNAKSSANIDWKGNGGAPDTAAEWNQVTPTGEAGVIYNYGKNLTVPTNINYAEAAYGETPPATIPTGVTVPTNGLNNAKGGIIIKPANNAAVEDMEFKVDAATGNQVVKVKVGNDIYNIIYAENNGTVTLPGTAVTVPITDANTGSAGKTIVVKNGAVGSMTKVNGLTNGLIHVEGNIGVTQGNSKVLSGMSGTIKGNVIPNPNEDPNNPDDNTMTIERTVTSTGTIALDGPVGRADIDELFKNNAPSTLPAGDSAARYVDPVNADYAFHPLSKQELKTWKNSSGQTVDKSSIFGRDNLMIFAKEDLWVSMDPDHIPTNTAQNQKVLNLFGQFLSGGTIKVMREQGNNSGQFNIIGALAQKDPLSHDQFINANSGGGNDNWDIKFLYDPQMAFKPSKFLPGLPMYSVKAFSEEIIGGH